MVKLLVRFKLKFARKNMVNMGHHDGTLKGRAKQYLEQVRSEKVIYWLCFKINCI